MNYTHIFPVLLILLNIGAAVTSALHGDVKKCIYFLAAAVLNITVAF